VNDIEQDVAWLVNKLGGQFSDDCKVFDRVVRALLAERDRLRTLLNRARKGLEWTVDEDDDIHQNLIEQIRAALTAGEKK